MPKKCFCLIVLLLPLLAWGQSRNEAGNPFLTTFTSKQYGGDLESWDFVQDRRGVMYIGNLPGVLEYDGVSWRMIENANKSLTRSLDIDENGRIYAGCAAEFGYLAPDNAGQMQYVSLMEFLPEADQQFEYVFSTNATREGVYFTALEGLFRFKPGKNEEPWQVKTWKSQQNFAYSFYVYDTLYVRLEGIGLMKMVNDSLHFLPGSEPFANDRTQVMLPFEAETGSGKAGNILIGTFNQGLFLYDGKSFQPFKTEVDEFLRRNVIYKGAVLADGTLGLATLDGGLIIIDRQGKKRQVIDRESGLNSNAILAIGVDRQGLLWLAPENTIVQIETPSPVTNYGPASGLFGGVANIIRYQGTLYVATGSGIFYLDPETSSFKPVSIPPGNPQSAGFLARKEGLLACAFSLGVLQINGNAASTVKRNPGGFSWSATGFHRSRQDSNLIFVGLFDGLTFLRWHPQKTAWIDEGRISGVTEQILTMVESEPGVLWLGTENRGILRLHYNAESLLSSKIERFDSQHGLSSDAGVMVYPAFGRIVFALGEGAYYFDEESQLFRPDTLLNQIGFSGSRLARDAVIEDRNGNVWIDFGKEKAVAIRRPDGSYQLDKTALLRFKDFGNTTIYPDPLYPGVIWFGGGEGLIRYDSNVAKNYAADYPALIRRVIVGEDSLLYGGAPEGTIEPIASTLRYENNSLRFEFAATSYEAATENEYQTLLKGFDKHWSGWIRETKKDYTNIPEGSYHFQVRAKNIYGHISEEASYPFNIRPPWYRSWWAYALYLIGFLGLVFGSGKIRSRQLESRNRTLEQTIAERTDEIRRRAEEMRTQKENIEQLSRISIKNLTAPLLATHIGNTIYEKINTLMDAATFGVAIFNEENQQLEFPAIKEKGETLPHISMPLDNDNRPAIWCYKNRKEMIINDWGNEYKQYLTADLPAVEGEDSLSVIYLPLLHQDKILGVITVQSFKKHAYTENHVDILRNLATFAAITLDNGEAYRQVDAANKDLQTSFENVELLSRIGRDITATLSIDGIIDTAYENVNALIDASVFGIGIHDPEQQALTFPATKEKGETLLPFTNSLDDQNRPAVWCFKNRKELVSNDWDSDYKRYIQTNSAAIEGDDPRSLIYLPLQLQDKMIGVITAQSFKKNAYNDYHLNILRNLATYTAIALDNAAAHKDLQVSFENVELLSSIGQEITASLDMDTIFNRLYDHVNKLADATIFGVGIYHPDQQIIEYRLAIEEGKRYKPYTREMSDKNQFPVWCIENRKAVLINDIQHEYSQYIETYREIGTTLEDGSVSKEPQSLIYLPLMVQERVLGVMTIQSYQKNAYSDYHRNIMSNLANYTSIALDNANAYEQLGDTQKRLLEEERSRLALLEAENQRQANELEAARDLQLSMLPKQMPDTPDYDIAAYMKTATEVGGDYYDFSEADDGTTIVGIGDATGHGINAGMVVTTMKSLFLASAANSDLLDFFTESNNAIEQIYESELLMGFQLLRIKDKQLSMSAGGMPPTYLFRAKSGEVEEIAIEAISLGGFVGYPYERFDFVLESGDTLLMSSDGYAELFNDKEEMLGYDTVRDLFGQIARQSSQEIIDKLVEAGDQWANGRPNDDDVTFVVVKVK